jgi:site-specific DNA recombinase
MFASRKENLEKKEIVIPSMIASLKAGNLMGICPIGYDHYGRKVRDERRFAFKQRIEINKDGEILREAWQWKLSGLYSDSQIIAKLATRGLVISKQKMSQMWRNPFYCGVSIHKLIDAPVKGNWEPLISQDDFIKVQQLLDKNPAGYSQNVEVDWRPLNRLLKCNDCEGFMVGYMNKKKNLHYYRCLKCTGVCMNANTTQRAKKIGAHELFAEYLKKFSIPESFYELVKMQLTKIFDRYNEGTVTSDKAVREQLGVLEKKLKDLKICRGLGEIDKETYDLSSTHLMEKIAEVTKELNTLARPILNLEKLISSSLKKLRNISQIWVSASVERKRMIQRVLFPDGVFYCVKIMNI